MAPLHQCPKCPRRTFTLVKLIQHIGLVHAHKAHFSITCGINDCCSTFSKYHSYRRHVYRKHKHSVFPSPGSNEEVNEESVVEQDNTFDADLTQQSTPPSIDKLLENLRENLFGFILKCREKNHLPLSVQQDIVHDLNFLFCFFKENYDLFISYHLEKNGFPISECPELQQVLSTPDFFDKACDVIRSPHMIKEHCKSKMDMTEPFNYELRNASGNKIGTFSYVPIAEVLKKYCSLEDVWEEIVADAHKIRDDQILLDYTDGIYFKEHSYFKDHPQALRLHFYEDEFEIVNPLGSKRSKYKMCAFYYSVGNVSTRYRSKLSHIHLALLVRCSHLKECGLDVILQPVVDDLKKLSTEGFVLNVNGHECRINAALATFSCDNLSAHMIGGFTMSFNSGRICRYCMASYSEMKQKFREESFVLRTAEVHRYHLECVENDPASAALYGVHGTCKFDMLDYFDVTSCLPPDIMHDLLEGVLPLVMKLVICEAHKQKHITIQEINNELKSMTIGKNDRANKPVLLSEKLLRNSAIVGSASQKWCLFRLLPFLMADHVPPDSPYWRVFKLCAEITDVVMAPTVRKDELAVLEFVVQEFLTEMTNVFGNVLTPKCHFLTHYPRLMLMFGPLRALWCMRFESKHQYFKNIASTCKNFRNITSTLSNRHQMKQCWEFSSKGLLCDFEETLSKSVSTPFSSLPAELQKALICNDALRDVQFQDKVLQRVSCVSVNNVKYSLGDVFVISHLHTEMIPLFWKVKYILNIDTLWVMCGKILVPVSFDGHFHAYRVTLDKDWTLQIPGKELDHQALDTYSVDDNLFVSMKYLV
ncbi:uncharacterized protein LOC125787802 isoform X1 [Astyanax mexicanus]|uniref:uncharacterized protein LOC125787802 isoform X1 n=1 Tax=Astyanax mexicanus TaxID=7994 RepID=UPI0020CB5DDA|nr:uncharacterized protein LOC125787802 isoform X1 [Astyanax mexicanus]XP_049328495.1 uncharacterized protein LOC125787802 isoform X1 [Astyanax mexicanus]